MEVRREPWPVAPALAAAWRGWAEEAENACATPEWLESWLEVAPGARPVVLSARLDGHPVGVLGLVAAGRPGLTRLGVPAAGAADWFSAACEREHGAAAGAAWAAHLRAASGWHVLGLDRVDETEGWARGFAAEAEAAAGAGGRGARLLRRGEAVLPYTDMAGGYDAWLAGRSRNFRSQLGRKRRKLERDHGLRFRRTERPQDVARDLDAVLELHAARWSDASALGLALERFHRAWAARAFRRGWLRLWIAEADGAPVAGLYGWRLGGRFCYYQSGLSARGEELSVGTVLLAHTMEQAGAEGAVVYDFLWGDESYKDRFATGRRTARTLVALRPASPLGLASAAGMLAADGARRLPEGLREPLRRGYRRARSLRTR